MEIMENMRDDPYIQREYDTLKALFDNISKPYNDMDEKEKHRVCRFYALEFCSKVMFIVKTETTLDNCMNLIRQILDTYGIENIEKIYKAISFFYKNPFWKQVASDMKQKKSINLKDNFDHIAMLCCHDKLTENELDTLTEEFLKNSGGNIDTYNLSLKDKDMPSLATLVRS